MGTCGRFAAVISAVLLAAGVHAPVSAAGGSGTIQGHVRLTGRAPGNPIIRMGMDPMCAAGAPVVIRQVKCIGQPRVVGAMVGQMLRIVNSDTLAHETHTANSTTNIFKVTQPHSDMVFDYTLKGPEEMLRLACDVHRWMTAWVGVEPHPFFNVTSDGGAFTIVNVPPGHHQIRAWHERYGWLTKTVDVKAGATATIDFAYTGQEHAGA